MYPFLKEFHSGWRYLVLLLIVIALLRALIGWLSNKPYTDGHRKTNLFALISAHVQFLVGLVLYFVSPFVQFGATTMSDKATRYWSVEHIFGMLIAIVLITIGHSKSKKAVNDLAKHKAIAIFYLIAIIVIVAVISTAPYNIWGMKH